MLETRGTEMFARIQDLQQQINTKDSYTYQSIEFIRQSELIEKWSIEYKQLSARLVAFADSPIDLEINTLRDHCRVLQQYFTNNSVDHYKQLQSDLSQIYDSIRNIVAKQQEHSVILSQSIELQSHITAQSEQKKQLMVKHDLHLIELHKLDAEYQSLQIMYDPLY